MKLFEQKILTCMYSLRNNMYNCIICFLKRISFIWRKQALKNVNTMHCIRKPVFAEKHALTRSAESVLLSPNKRAQELLC